MSTSSSTEVTLTHIPAKSCRMLKVHLNANKEV